MGYLEMNANDFWDIQYNELIIRYETYRDKQESKYKHDYDLARWQSFLLLQPHIDSKKGNLNSPVDLVRFEWDKKQAPITQELTEEQLRVISNMDNAVFTKEDVFDELYTIGKTNGNSR